ncbi:Hypothetical protein R9X50_00245200 [Acrodontium crateriforme]|uniref:Phosphatidic acid phosphatase type 2/haloperoxidase domain-containing protein n=1 Tax=Acrodontium crateriforme TaxID=150365 RepID=A0AAQ3M162_9PEZI|nr:Hypothetical protein R9X50_00245200 [Acrodontium crateriforme]
MAIAMPSVRLVISYVLDWIVIIVIAAIGGAINFVQPYMRPFSLLNLDISYPMVTESVSTVTLILVSLVAPAVVIALVVLVLVPGPGVVRSSTRSQIIRLKLWEFEKGWAGLALSLATAFFLTQGMKNLFGKPRPSMIARCQPDLSDVAAHVIGGYGQDISARWTLVSASICAQADKNILHDAFRSFPSGHSSFSWSGLLYLSLFLCSKFQISIPYLPIQTPPSTTALSDSNPEGHELLQMHRNGERNEENGNKRSIESNAPNTALLTIKDSAHPLDVRNGAASPPNYLIIPAFVPVAAAIFICSTRYAEFYHFGFDIISGSLIGILTASFSFRWYHLPLNRGQGWAWGARSRERAFGICVGTSGYVGNEGWERTRKRTDIEVGRT